MREVLRKACEKAGSQKAWAANNGYRAQFVSFVLNGTKAMPNKMGNILGFDRVEITTWNKRKQ